MKEIEVKHRSAKSKGLKFDSPSGIQISPLFYAHDKTNNIFPRLHHIHYRVSHLVNPLNPKYEYTYSPNCSLYIPKRMTNKENLFKNQELLYLVNIAFLLVTLLCDLGMIM